MIPPQKCYRVLLVEHSAQDVALVQSLFDANGAASFELSDIATDLCCAEAILDRYFPDLILLDLNLPGFSGVEALESLRKNVPYIPVIALTEAADDGIASKVIHEGAQDCITKSELTPRFLLHLMRYAVERERADNVLVRQQEFLDAMLQSSPDRIYFKDAKSRFLRINDALARVFGLASPDAAIGKTDFDFFPGELAEKKFADEQGVLASGTPVVDRVELEVPKAGGTRVWLLTTKLPLRDRRGRIVGTFGLSRDITVIKEMEDALFRERNLLRSVIDNVPDFIHVKDCAGRYILNNAAHCELLHAASPADLFGKTVFDFFPEPLAAQYHADDLAIIDSGKPLLYKVEPTLVENGQQRWLSTTKVPLRDKDGQITGVVFIARDITEQKLAGEKLEETNKELTKNREALMRTVEELHQVQLQLVEAEKMKLVGRLAAGVAHEVKNPLAIVAMSVDYLEHQKFDDSNVAMILRECRDAVLRADSVVRGLLDFSAPSKLQVTSTDLNAIVRQALLLVRGELSQGKFNIVEELVSPLPSVAVDVLKMEQVFVNIITNAVHAMKSAGTLTVRTSTRLVMGTGENISGADMFRLGDQLVEAEVLDNGPGIAPEALNKIFEPFFTTKPTGKGTGLGLTVTKTIIDLHGGTISIRNRPEGGASVLIVLKASYPPYEEDPNRGR